MTYPMAPALTLRQFIDKTVPHGVVERSVPGGMVGPRGDMKISYLEIARPGAIRVTEPLPENEESLLAWDTVRRLCRQLEIQPRDLDIGLPLD